VPAVPNPAAALVTFSVAWVVALPLILIVFEPPLISPPAPCTVSVSANVIPVLPT